jgi:hypothetical protein
MWPTSSLPDVSSACGRAVERTDSTCSAPLRRTPRRMSASGRIRMASIASSQESTSLPSTETISSPGRTPARAAGESGSTAPMTAGEKSVASTSPEPVLNKAVRRPMVSTAFMKGPAR